MPVQITTQKQARECRDRLRDCYICSEALPARESPEWNGETVIEEHVVPRCILALTPTSPAESWPLVLPVHKRCDEWAKRDADQLTKVVHVLNTRGPDALADAERGVVRKKLVVGEVDVGESELTPTLSGVGVVLDNIHLWARGFYAALYGEVPQASVRQQTRAPSPAFDSTRPDPARQLREQEKSTEAILVLVVRASKRGLTDRVELLGGKIRFECVWFQRRDGDAWQCYWTLELPGSTKWALETQRRDVPWHGAYELPAKPDAAAAAPIDEICKAIPAPAALNQR
jgi:hypothetical protein